jgi:hypothetical protein
MLPTEMEHKSSHVQQFNEEQLDDSRANDLTRLEELREAVVMRRYHAWNISSHSFQVEDFLL